ncbi:MAG: hypothetical protein E3J21_01450 [Anaerolineales bacterium]|nr:MAG: hypothetical protein E3J21_01450 [Anaerolineales bacterium]
MHEKIRQYSLETLPLGGIANANDLARRYPDLCFGESWFNGVRFLLNANYFQTGPNGPRYTEFKSDKPLGRTSSVHLLVNAANAWKRHKGKNLEGVTIGRVQLLFDDETAQETLLILGRNLREWAPGNKPGELVDKVTDPLSQVAWKGRNDRGNEAIIDQLEIPVQERHRKKGLKQISISRDIQPGTPEDILVLAIFAITLER